MFQKRRGTRARHARMRMYIRRRILMELGLSSSRWLVPVAIAWRRWHTVKPVRGRGDTEVDPGIPA